MSARAIRKGHLSIGDLGCAVTLCSPVYAEECTAFHIIKRDTGHRVHPEYVDEDSRRPVGKDDLVEAMTPPKARRLSWSRTKYAWLCRTVTSG